VCGEDCRPLGCGDGTVEANEECDPPELGECDGQCKKIECGNGRMDEGEDCDPPAAESCDASCQRIECGNGRVETGEDCDPPVFSLCNDECKETVCGDGRLDPGEACEPSNWDARCSGDCAIVDTATGTEYLYTFDTDVQGWQLFATSPERLEASTQVGYDAQNGDQTPGVLELLAPFDGANQKIEVQASFSPMDMQGRTLRARVRLENGLSSDAQNPGGIKLFAKAGANYNYASGEWTYLRPGEGWVEVTLDCDAPILVPESFDASEVRQVGVELRTFNETTSVSPATVFMDAVSY